MARLLMLLGLTFCLCALQVSAYVTDEDFKRALLTLRDLEEEKEHEERGIVDCKHTGEGCTGIIHCCGTLQCYWEKGYTVLKKGECVRCVKQGQHCQRDSQCCGVAQVGQSLQCNKGNRFWVDGTCEVYRSSGECYRDGQCVRECNKKWYQTHGTCS